MKIRLIGALLCGGLFVLEAPSDLFAQSGRNNTVQGNYIGTSGGMLIPADTNVDGRRRSKGTQGLLNNDLGVGYARTTVKSSKFNTSDRMGGGGGKGGTKRQIYTCMTDDGYGRKRPCSAGYKAANPN